MINYAVHSYEFQNIRFRLVNIQVLFLLIFEKIEEDQIVNNLKTGLCEKPNLQQN